MIFALIFVAAACGMNGQRSIDRIFEKYAGSHDFFTMHLSGNLLKFVSSCDGDDEGLPQEVNEIRLLSQKDESEGVPGFFNAVMKDLDTREYEEFMRINSADENTVLLVKGQGKEFSEFLLVSGGEHNLLVQVKGSFTMKDAKKFSENMKKNHCNISLSASR